jgi:NitT/TauT family transport system substrate-binding protein
MISRLFAALLILSGILCCHRASAQERVKIAYSSADASNTVWFTALDSGLYRKYGLDVELIFIQSSTMSVSTVVSGDVQVANTSGGAVASAAVGGANPVMTACYIIRCLTGGRARLGEVSGRSARQGVGISRVGSAPMSARVLLKGLGLEPVKDVAILQVGGPSERAAAFRTKRIVGFPSPPGTIHLAQGMPHRVMISTADFQKRFDFPYICSTTTKGFLAARHDTMRRLTMALIESTHFLKTHKDETKKFIAKYTRQNNPQYLEDSYVANVKLHERVPRRPAKAPKCRLKKP